MSTTIKPASNANPSLPTTSNAAGDMVVLPPCPSWCRHVETVGPNHDYDCVSQDGATLWRYHVDGQAEVHLSQCEYARDGVLTLDPILVTIGDEQYDLEGARGVARLILDAVLAVERLTGVRDQS